MLVNSMPDERTNSTITWLNSPYRGNQKASTIIDMVLVNQWYSRHDPSASNKASALPKYRPVVKFRHISPLVLERLKSRSAGLSASSDSDEPENEDGGESDGGSESEDADSDDDSDAGDKSDGGDEDYLEVTIPSLVVDQDIDIDAPGLRDLLASNGPSDSSPRAEAAEPARPPAKRAKNMRTEELNWKELGF
ncbi:hypothetical protein K523DRAFT_421554 [Schizophyllum commune Tattone D]|nr:hypothetical protein K523DRAFT_421554 [Schizophyllum commune Tattone D]